LVPLGNNTQLFQIAGANMNVIIETLVVKEGEAEQTQDRFLKKIFVSRVFCVLSFAMSVFLASEQVSKAALTTYTDLASWTAAAGSPIVVEDFADYTLVPGLSISFGKNSPAGYIYGGTYNDVGVTQFNDANNPQLQFAGGTFVFGADWDLSPGGAGDGLILVLGFADSTSGILSIGNPPSGAFNGFFGFVSDVAVTSIRLDSPGTGVEGFSMDNARLRSAVANKVSFDDAPDGTVINVRYPGVTFTNPIGGNVYARYGTGFAPSASNVVSVFATGIPAFNAFYGAVDAYLATPVGVVMIDVRPLAPPEFLTPLTKKPFLQAFDSANNLLGTVYYSGPLPTGGGELGAKEALTFSSPANNIAAVRFSVQNPSSSPSGPATYGFFDNFRFGQPSLTVTSQAAQMVLSWPADASDLLLVSATNLAPPVNWQPWSGPQTTHAGINSVTTGTTNDSRFFRLLSQ
jgi:hypothetical protein